MMEVGRINGGTVEWSKAHFGAWCVVSAPLIIGLDITDTKTLSGIVPFLTNPEAIAVNQQFDGHPGRLAKTIHTTGNLPVQVWVKPQPKGALAVYVVNPVANSTNADVEVSFADLGLPQSAATATVRDIWSRSDLATATGSVLKASVPAMDSVFYLLTPNSEVTQLL